MNEMKKLFLFIFFTILFFPQICLASGGGHESPVEPVLLGIVILILAGRIGGDIAIRLKQPEVLGELVVGVILGNLVYLGVGSLEDLKHNANIEVLAEIGVILLLFEVGLETNIKEMSKVGASSFCVALLGIIAPFFAGWGVAMVFLPEAGSYVHAFIGATLCATSVGITARVLKELGAIERSESKIILGAAVIDDVLGLLVLTVIGSIISAANMGQELEFLSFAKIIFVSVGFLTIAIIVGTALSPYYFKMANYLRSHGILLVASLTLCFGLSWIAAEIGLATIIGAFTAGLVLDRVHYQKMEEREKMGRLEDLLRPISMILTPIFFVLMGLKVELGQIISPEILGFALALSIAAICGKQICSFGVLDKNTDKIAVGLGMIPRGEVGLIFAGIGLNLQIQGEAIIDSASYGAVVIMVIITTMITPPLITWRLRNQIK